MRARWLLAVAALALTPLVGELTLRLLGPPQSSRLFAPGTGANQGYYFDQVDYTRPFFAQGLRRDPVASRVPATKAPHELRVVVLGESAAMGDPLPEFGMPRVLQAMLETDLAPRPVRVINAAMTAINSHVIRHAARECMDLQPDLFVLYMGNNEIVGPFGPGTIFSGFYHSRLWIRTQIAVRRSRMGRWWRQRIDSWLPSRDWAGMAMFTARPFGPDDSDVILARRHFRANLEDILRMAERRRVPVLLCTVAVNMDDCPPFLPPPGDESFAQARAAEAQGRRAEAWRDYEQAANQDQLRFRADPGIQDILCQAAARAPTGSVRLVDAAGHFRRLYLNGQAGHQFFVDHVHFTFAGNVELARLIARAMPLAGGPDSGQAGEEYLRQRLGYSPWAELAVLDTMAARFRRAPFYDQQDHPRRMARIVAQTEDVRDRAEKTSLTATIQEIEQQAIWHPDDADLYLWLGRLLLRRGDAAAALQAFRQAVALWPHHMGPRGHTALAQTLAEGATSALSSFRPAGRRGADSFIELVLYLAPLLQEGGELEAAQVWVAEGLREQPNEVRLLVLKGQLLIARGRAWEAVPALELALTRQPEHGRALSALGVACGEQGDWTKACRYFAESLRVMGDDAEVLYHYGVALAKTGEEDTARVMWSRVLEIHPADRDATKRMADLAWRSGRVEESQAFNERLRLIFPHQPALRLRADLLAARLGRSAPPAHEQGLARPAASDRLRILSQALESWLASTRAPSNQPASETARRYLERPLPTETTRNVATLLIEPAVLARLGRYAEARQKLQAALIFMERPTPSTIAWREALTQAVEREECFSSDQLKTTPDPVLDALWQASLNLD